MSRRGKAKPPKDMALWEHVKQSVAPLKAKHPQSLQQTMADLLGEETAPNSLALKAPKAEKPKLQHTTKQHVAALPSYTPPLSPSAAAKLPIAPLEKRFKRQLRRSDEVIDARIDLHGMTGLQAHAALRGFLHNAHARGDKLVLVITGKGKASDLVQHNDYFSGRGTGLLKRSTPLWLSEPDLRHIVLGFEAAAPHHGGSGALYVRLRRIK
jgi:DNA-nicking Smr family endonuclease